MMFFSFFGKESPSLVEGLIMTFFLTIKKKNLDLFNLTGVRRGMVVKKCSCGNGNGVMK